VELSFSGRLWPWDRRKADSWVFVSLPPELADEIDHVAQRAARGFGSVRVEATVGPTTWRTSVFPDSSARTYVLPLKRAVRAAAGIDVDDEAHVRLRVLDA
jgi:hypothetical protein